MLKSLGLVILWFLILSINISPFARAELARDAPTDFDAKVAPILARRCLDCHSGGDPKGKLDLSSRVKAMVGGESGELISVGKPEESLIWERINTDEMPPKTPLSKADKATIREWITSGATWGTDPIDPYQVTTERRAGRDWWSLQPVRRPEPPEVRAKTWIRTPIDAFIAEKLEANGLAPAPEADRPTLARRLSFDLIGLPPSPEEIRQFVNDVSDDAYDRLVDRLLSSPQYGVRWARWWLDLARYGESNGFEYDEFRPNAWRYRDWVVNSLNRDLPYDQFVRLQLAGDVLSATDPTAVEATGFLVAGAYDTVGQNQQSPLMKSAVRSDELEDYISTVSQTFLGLTVHCARCHDHKFDPIRQVEYYRFASNLGGVRPAERDLSTIDPAFTSLQKQRDERRSDVEAIEAPARALILKSRKSTPLTVVIPFAAWDFKHGLEDRLGSLKISLHGGAKLTPEGLHFDGTTGYAITPTLTKTLAAKTIEVWVKLDTLDQRGGGVISLQSDGGSRFDAIVFGEQESKRWMAGSDNFRRTLSLAGEAESDAKDRTVHIAMTYSEDGYVNAYREGKPYGKGYKSVEIATFPADTSELIFGMRHGPAGGNRMLAGTIQRARLYDRALNPAEVAASAGEASDYVGPTEITAILSDEERTRQARLRAEIEVLGVQITSQARKAYAVLPIAGTITHVQVRGNPQQLGEVVAPGGVTAIIGPDADFALQPDAPEGERRVRLANWMTDRKNPLFARVIVNRLWQAHFGIGLVETPSDFGFNAGRPSHPELLDWLAAEMVSQGFSLKTIHKQIVMSATYRQSSRSNSAAVQRDAGNRLLWRKSPQRLEAEMVRDAMLSVSGNLDNKLGGASFRDQEAVKAPGTPAMLYTPLDPAMPGLNRRTLYRAAARGRRNTFLDAFDCPDPSTTAPRRGVTTTPLQALAMMNNKLVLHLSDLLESRLIAEVGPDPARQVDLTYQLAFGRDPTGAEQAKAIEVVKNFGVPTLARAIFNSNEFLYVE